MKMRIAHKMRPALGQGATVAGEISPLVPGSRPLGPKGPTSTVPGSLPHGPRRPKFSFLLQTSTAQFALLGPKNYLSDSIGPIEGLLSVLGLHRSMLPYP